MKNILIALFLIAAFSWIGLASAQTTTSTSLSAGTPTVSSLQELVAQLQKQVLLLQVQLNEIKSELSTTKTELSTAKEEIAEVKAELKLTRNLRLGTTGDDVKQLQEFLKQFKDVYPEGLVTGYFGPLTEKAVQKWQEKQGIVTSGDATTTGYGQVGPRTIAKINELITEGAGQSGVIPPGLLTAPGIQKKLDVTPSTSSGQATPPVSTTTSPTATTTLPVATTTTSTGSGQTTTTYIYVPVVSGSGGSGSGGTTTTSTSSGQATSTTTTATTTTTTTTTATTTTTTAVSHTCGTPVNVPQDASSIQAGLNAACSGDTVYVSAGTYYENLSIPRSGITLKGAQGTTAETVIIDGKGTGNVVFATGIQDFTIDGFTLRNASQYNHSSCSLFPCSAGIWFVNPPSNNVGATIMRNLIVKNNFYGVWVQGILAGNITFERNVVVDNLDLGVHMGVCGSSSAIITNNTIANNKEYGYMDSCLLGNRTLRNNIIAKNGKYGIYLYANSQRTILYNDVWSNTGGNYYNLSLSGTLPFTPSPGTGELSLDPKFVSASDYHLQSTSASPAIDTGDPGSQYNDPDGSRNDMGAYPLAGTVTGDTTPPVISSVVASVASASTTTATVNVTWLTNEASDSRIRYGTSTATYGFEQIFTSLVTSHSITLSGFLPSTTYYYRVRSQDAAGNIGASDDYTFTTAAYLPPAPTNIQAVTSASSQNQPPQMWYYMTFDYTLLSTTQSFNIYRKRPSDASFVKYTYNAQTPVNASILPLPGSDESNLYHRYANQWQYWTTVPAPAPASAAGEYQFYVTAVDTNGIESAPSPTKSLKIYAAPVIVSPADGSTVSSPFTITVTGDPSAPNPTYGMALYRQTTGSTAWSAWPAPGTSFTYPGPGLSVGDNPHRLVVWLSADGSSFHGTSVFNVATTTASMTTENNLAVILTSLAEAIRQLQQMLR